MDNPDIRKARVAGLDLVRALAIIQVLACHIWMIGFDRGAVPSLLGTYGVDLFFVLSGFLIGGILLRQLLQKPVFGLSDVRHFWQRRWWRTLPSYLLFLIIYACLAAQHGSVPNLIPFFTFTQNLIPGFEPLPLFAVSWSLAIEEWMYILLPLIICLSMRLFQGKANFAAASSIVLLLVVPTLCRILFAANYSFDDVVRKAVIFRLDAIAMGVVVAYFSIFNEKLFSKLAGMKAVIVSTLLLITATAWYIGTFQSLQNNSIQALSRVLINAFFFPIVDFAFVLLIASSSRIATLPKPIGMPIRLISTYSYSLYLSHALVIHGLQHILHARHIAPNCLVFIVICCISTFVISGLLFHIFEKPCTDLRDRFAKSA